MSTSDSVNNILAVRAASDRRYKFQKNGTVKKLGADGKFRAIGTTRHGYNVFSYKGAKLVTARVLVARGLLDSGFGTQEAAEFLGRKIVVRSNGDSLNDSRKNIYTTVPRYVVRGETRRLTRKQIDRMLELFFDGYSVAKIARRFRRKVSRSYLSAIIKRELNLKTLEA